MNKTTEALKLAEEALSFYVEDFDCAADVIALAAIREALADHGEQNLTMVAEPVSVDAVNTPEKCVDETGNNQHEPVKQEPVAWEHFGIPSVNGKQAEKEPYYFGLTHDHTWLSIDKKQYDKLKPEYRMACYIAPVRTKDMTDDEIMDLVRDECVDMRWPSTPLFIARAVIAAHKEKNK